MFFASSSNAEQKLRAELLYSGQYGDSYVNCRGTIFKTHRAILATRSEYFAKLFGSGFLESVTATAKLDEDPALMGKMMQYLYTDQYVYDDSVVGKYGLGPLDSDVQRREDEQMFHVQVYALADRLMTPELKELARKNFYDSWYQECDDENNGDVEVFDEAEQALLRLIYTSTPATDRGLRDIVLLSKQIEVEECNMLKHEQFRSFLEEVPAFGADLLSKPTLPGTFICDLCADRRAVLSNPCKCGRWSKCEKEECINDILRSEECRNCWRTGTIRKYEYGKQPGRR